jgi:uncharacterized protein
MYRLGVANLKGELGLAKNPRDAIKWLRLSIKYATPSYPHAFFTLSQLYIKGIPHLVWTDTEYMMELLKKGYDISFSFFGGFYIKCICVYYRAELGDGDCCYTLGDVYQFGKFGLEVDVALSVHYYRLGAEKEHPDVRPFCFYFTHVH